MRCAFLAFCSGCQCSWGVSSPWMHRSVPKAKGSLPWCIGETSRVWPFYMVFISEGTSVSHSFPQPGLYYINSVEKWKGRLCILLQSEAQICDVVGSRLLPYKVCWGSGKQSFWGEVTILGIMILFLSIFWTMLLRSPTFWVFSQSCLLLLSEKKALPTNLTVSQVSLKSLFEVKSHPSSCLSCVCCFLFPLVRGILPSCVQG